MRLRYLLVMDGSSDKALQYVLDWLLKDLLTNVELDPQHHYQQPRKKPSESQLSSKIKAALKLYAPVDILFVHRDAERERPEVRVQEIETALMKVEERPQHVCLVPVRMTEAWLLFDEGAIRQAAGNPNGRNTLELPSLAEVEKLREPKERLHMLLRQASGLQGRRLKPKHFNVHQITQRVAELIQDYQPLRELSAFQRLETDVREWLLAAGWSLAD